MLRAQTPFTLLNESLASLLGHLPGVRDGDEAAIHQARVDIRRTREVVALASTLDDSDVLPQVDRVLQRTARHLGRARDADVVFELVQDLEARFRGPGTLLTQFHGAAYDARHRMRRKAFKMLERGGPEALPAEVAPLKRSRLHHLSGGQVRHAVRQHLASRAANLRDAIGRAGGVRFGGRLHDVRIAATRLRYALDLADRIRVGRPSGLRRILKRTQEALGNLHDRDVLLEAIHDVDATRPDFADQRAMIEQFVRVDADRAHALYLSQRPELLAICDACEGVDRRWTVNRTAIAAAGVAFPSVMLLLARRARRDEARHEDQRRALAG